MLLFTLLLAVSVLRMCSAAAFVRSPSPVLLPKPTGIYQVGRSVATVAELINYSRTQPFVQDIGPIKLMISVFYPVIPQHHSTKGAYMPPETALFEDLELSGYGLAAPNGTFEKVALHLASNEPVQNLTDQPSCQYPLVLFMPAEGTTRLFYGQIASTIASTGYTVITIDAPYDVDVVQYPDNSLAIINETLWGTNNLTALNRTAYVAISSQVGDVSFVLDSLSNTNVRTLTHPEFTSIWPKHNTHGDVWALP